MVPKKIYLRVKIWIWKTPEVFTRAQYLDLRYSFHTWFKCNICKQMIHYCYCRRTDGKKFPLTLLYYLQVSLINRRLAFWYLNADKTKFAVYPQTNNAHDKNLVISYKIVYNLVKVVHKFKVLCCLSVWMCGLMASSPLNITCQSWGVF